MGDIAKSVLGGAWLLVVGWILPCGLNLLVLAWAAHDVLPHGTSLGSLWKDGVGDATLAVLVAATVTGLMLNALQNPLYRVLEGYLAWPHWLYARRCEHYRSERRQLRDRVTLLRLERKEAADAASLSASENAELTALRADPKLARIATVDRTRSAVQRSLLREKLKRYPISPDQIAPTQLGNAIRRFEEYAVDRYRLDSQSLWNEITGVADDQLRHQMDQARTSVDFFVALLWGHAVVALALLGLLPEAHGGALLRMPVTAAVLLLLCFAWYRMAIGATDEWAATVRAAVNLTRKPLAERLGLDLPATLEDEREMWRLVSGQSRAPYRKPPTGSPSPLDRFRHGGTP